VNAKPNPYWYCRLCHAVNPTNTTEGMDGRCWNCKHKHRRPYPKVKMGTETCEVCGLKYVTWTLPTRTVYREMPCILGFCPFYFDHYGDTTYYPPMLPAQYVLDANGYDYDEETNTVVKHD
jgi:hypothetical protein